MTRPIIQFVDAETGEDITREMNDAEYADWLAQQPNEAEQNEALKKSIINATQARLDKAAQDHGYDSILSLCTYATSQVPRFAAEGQYGVTLRDETWATLVQIYADVEAGTRPIPTWEQVEAELPALVWPATS